MAQEYDHHQRREPELEDAFAPEDRVCFHRQTGDLLIDLGYESSADWAGDADANGS